MNNCEDSSNSQTLGSAYKIDKDKLLPVLSMPITPIIPDALENNYQNDQLNKKTKENIQSSKGFIRVSRDKKNSSPGIRSYFRNLFNFNSNIFILLIKRSPRNIPTCNQ